MRRLYLYCIWSQNCIKIQRVSVLSLHLNFVQLRKYQDWCHIFLKIIYYQTENFHKNATFLSIYNKFWILQNSDQIIDSLNKINKKKRIKSITIYDFSTLYTKLPHDKLVDKLSSIIDFAFKGVIKSRFEYQQMGKHFGEIKLRAELVLVKQLCKQLLLFL